MLYYRTFTYFFPWAESIISQLPMTTNLKNIFLDQNFAFVTRVMTFSKYDGRQYLWADYMKAIYISVANLKKLCSNILVHFFYNLSKNVNFDLCVALYR